MSQDPTFEVENWDGAEETKPAFDVVVVCDDRSAARRATKFLTELVREFGDEFEFQHTGASMNETQNFRACGT